MFAGGRVPKRAADLVQSERKNKALRGFVHQVHGGPAPRMTADLVQRERKSKALQGFVHQVPRDRSLKQRADLVQRERRNKALRGFVHQVPHGGRRLILQKTPLHFCKGVFRTSFNPDGPKSVPND